MKKWWLISLGIPACRAIRRGAALLLVAGCILLCAGAGMAGDRPGLAVQYIDFPPYYYADAEGRPAGFLLKLARRAFERAGIPVVSWECLPAKRVLSNLRMDRPIASIGWFRTPDRKGKYKFSSLLYENKQLRALYLKKYASLFAGQDRLVDLLRNKALRPGLLEGYSLGAMIDTLIRRENPEVVRVVGDYGRMVRMLAEERFSYIIIAPEAIPALVRKNHLNPAIFGSMVLSDIDMGDKRYLMFSRAVPDDWVRRIDRALEEIKKEQ